MTEPLLTFLIDTSVAGAAVDPPALLHHIAALLAADAASLALADTTHSLRVVAATHEPAGLLQARQIGLYDLYDTAQPGCIQADLRLANPYWTDCNAPGSSAGYRYAAGIALHLDGDTVGALNLFRVRGRAFSPEELDRARAMAVLASALLAQQRTVSRVGKLAGQLQQALSSRVVIEQAKGILAERFHLDMTGAFGLLRKQARNGNLRLHEVARSVVEGSPEQTAGHASPRLAAGAVEPRIGRTRPSATETVANVGAVTSR
jgi:hypothetical protein